MEVDSGNVEQNCDERVECRTCLERFDSNLELVDIYQGWNIPWDGMESTVADDLSKIAHIEIKQTDQHSKLICQLCYVKLQESCNFINNVKKNDIILRQRFPVEDELWPKPIALEKNVNDTLFKNYMEVEIKQEIISDCENDNANEYPEMYNVEVKLEPEEIQPIKITVNGTIPLEEFKNQSSINGEHELDIQPSLEVDSQVKGEPPSEDDETVVLALTRECILCAKSFKSVTGLKAHVIAQHSYKSVKRKTTNEPTPEKKKRDTYVCATCRRTFLTQTDLMVHETCHNKWACYGCSEKFDSFELLTNHRKRCKAISSKQHHKPKMLEDVIRPPIDHKVANNTTNSNFNTENDISNSSSKNNNDLDLPKTFPTVKDVTSLRNDPLIELLKGHDTPEYIIPEFEDSITDTSLDKDKETELKCSLCPQTFTDSYYLRIHEEIHHCGTKTELDGCEIMETEALENIFGE